MKPHERIGPLADFDIGLPKAGGLRYKAPPPRPSKVKLRRRDDGSVSEHFIVDASEILRPANTIYERIEGETYPASMESSTPTPKEAA